MKPIFVNYILLTELRISHLGNDIVKCPADRQAGGRKDRLGRGGGFYFVWCVKFSS